MNARRHEERPVRLIHVQPTDPSSLEGEPWRRNEYRIDLRSGSWATAGTSCEPAARTALLLELDPGRALLTAPSKAAPVIADGSGGLSTAVLLAITAERELQRDLERLLRCERFVVLADLLATAETPSEVYLALVEHLPAILAAWKTVVLRRSTDRGVPVMLSVVGGEEFGLAGAEWSGFPDCTLPAVALLERDTPCDGEEPLQAFGRSVFDHTPAARLACAGIGDDAIAVVAERRTGRDFTPQDWDLLRVASRQAAAALDRLR